MVRLLVCYVFTRVIYLQKEGFLFDQICLFVLTRKKFSPVCLASPLSLPAAGVVSQVSFLTGLSP